MVCSSLNRDLSIMFVSFVGDELYLKLPEETGLRSLRMREPRGAGHGQEGCVSAVSSGHDEPRYGQRTSIGLRPTRNM